ncbi:right-handed parallel beta-helix repeat-containing protein, partial [Desulfosarcina cetonica]
MYCADASPTIQNCTIQHSSANGIYLTGSSNPMIGGEDSGNIISNNGTYGIYSDVSSPFPTITHNTLSDNGSYAMRLRPRMSDV